MKIIHRGKPWLAAVLMATGLAGCTDAITVWPVAGTLRGNPVVDVPDLAGQWRAVGDGTDGPTLEVGQVPGDKTRCRNGTVIYTEAGRVTHIGDQTCFIDIDGSLVAELRSVEPMAGFYRQYLVRIDAARIEVCTGFPVWVVLDALRKESAVGFTFDTLDFTVREQESGDLMVFISKPEPLREFLATALPEAAAACDRDDEGYEWIAFERIEPADDPSP